MDRDFNKANFEAIGRYLSDIDWIGSFATVNTIDGKYELFLAILNDAINIFVPLVHMSKNARYKIPQYLERMISLTKSPMEGCANWDRYKVFDKKLTKCMVKYNTYLERKDPTKLFTYITKRLKDTKKIPALRVDEAKIIILDHDKAEVLAESFQKVFTEDSDTVLDEFPSGTSSMEPSLWFHRDEIYRLLSKWPSSYSITPDLVPFNFIKNIAQYIAFPLELLFNLSYMRSEVPSRWRHSFVVPIPKKPPFSDPSNYRPI
ncbi:hypothetical protein OSTOST_25748, partial [Ostertagia ostertagi]